jgi:hypothetical protein
MTRRSCIAPPVSLLALAALVALGAGCATALSKAEVEVRLEQAASELTGQRRSRVIPIYAESQQAAWGLLTEAKVDSDSPLSKRTNRRMALAAKRRSIVVVGGPYAGLSDRVVTNAIALDTEHELSGLQLVFVSPESPSTDLQSAARSASVRLVHRALP